MLATVSSNARSELGWASSVDTWTTPSVAVSWCTVVRRLRVAASCRRRSSPSSCARVAALASPYTPHHTVVRGLGRPMGRVEIFQFSVGWVNCLQCFDTVGWAAGSSGVLAWLSVWSKVHTAQLMPLPLKVSCFS